MPYQSVLDDLPTFEWDSQESVSYEVAIEAICFAVAALTAAINEAQQRGDEQQVAELVEIQKRSVVERNQLVDRPRSGRRGDPPLPRPGRSAPRPSAVTRPGALAPCACSPGLT